MSFDFFLIIEHTQMLHLSVQYIISAYKNITIGLLLVGCVCQPLCFYSTAKTSRWSFLARLLHSFPASIIVLQRKVKIVPCDDERCNSSSLFHVVYCCNSCRSFARCTVSLFSRLSRSAMFSCYS